MAKKSLPRMQLRDKLSATMKVWLIFNLFIFISKCAVPSTLIASPDAELNLIPVLFISTCGLRVLKMRLCISEKEAPVSINDLRVIFCKLIKQLLAISFSSK